MTAKGIEIASAALQRLGGKEADRIVFGGIDLLASSQPVLRQAHQTMSALQRQQVLPDAS